MAAGPVLSSARVLPHAPLTPGACRQTSYSYTPDFFFLKTRLPLMAAGPVLSWGLLLSLFPEKIVAAHGRGGPSCQGYSLAKDAIPSPPIVLLPAPHAKPKTKPGIAPYPTTANVKTRFALRLSTREVLSFTMCMFDRSHML